jgi:hypothetical protein
MATTATANLPCDNSTAANYRLWAAFISQSFYNFGWTQTSDSGQATSGSIGSLPNWSGVALPSNIATNYEVWKAADSAASTTPIYVKVEYGTSGAVEIRVTVGSGSNGSGAITGTTTGALIPTNNTTYANNGSTLYPSFASGTAGEIRFMLYQGTGDCTVFGIERSKDTSGNVTTSYVTFLCANAAGTNAWLQYTLYLGGLSLNDNWVTTTGSNQMGTGNYFGTTAAYPIFPMVGFVGNPMLGFLSAQASDVGEGAMITISIYGGNHTYIATKVSNFASMGKMNLNGNSGACLMRYE